MDGFLAALKCYKNTKSADTDGLNFKHIKYAPALLHVSLLNVINVMTTGHIPKHYQLTKVVPTFKKETHNDCDNYTTCCGEPA